MAKKNYTQAKSRRESGAFLALPLSILTHPNFSHLNGSARKLLFDLCSQLRVKKGGIMNNGDLCAAMSVLKKYGWKSNETLNFALKELLYYEFITLTRLGGRNKCHLYAVTWLAIDECNGKLDVLPTKVPGNEWKKEKEKWKRPERKSKSLHRKTNNITPIHGAKI